MSDSNPISFRVTAHQRKLLEDEAEELGLSSPDLAARKIIIEHLMNQPAESPVARRLDQIEAELAEARADLSVATEVLLVFAGKLDDAAARDWVSQNLPR
jgi:hypothetical protein